MPEGRTEAESGNQRAWQAERRKPNTGRKAVRKTKQYPGSRPTDHVEKQAEAIAVENTQERYKAKPWQNAKQRGRINSIPETAGAGGDKARDEKVYIISGSRRKAPTSVAERRRKVTSQKASENKEEQRKRKRRTEIKNPDTTKKRGTKDGKHGKQGVASEPTV